jgi:hypothetical protein
MATLKTEPRRAAQAAAGRLSRLIYASTAREPLDGRGLARLVRHARAANRAAGVTGVLVYDAGRFLQVLEGPAPTVAALATRIAADPRHVDFDVISEQTGIRRGFAGWDMQLALRGRGGPAEVLHPLHPPGALFGALHGAEDRLPALLSALAFRGRGDAGRLGEEDAALCGAAMARFILARRALPEAARLDALAGGAAAGIEAAARRIEAAAEALGRMWRADLCSGVDLAAGLACLQGALRRRRRVCPNGAEPGHVAVAATPGEPHILGALIKADLLRARGWHVTLHLPGSATALADTVAALRPDGLVIGSSRAQPRTDRLGQMAMAIAEVRRAMGARRFFVAAGGLDFARGLPAAAVGADMACRAASDIVRLLASGGAGRSAATAV